MDVGLTKEHMSSNYPTGLDNLPTTRDPDDLIGPDVLEHADSINKVQAELGLNPSGGFSTVRERLDSMWFNAMDYGLLEAGTAAANKMAIDNALDVCESAGGGVVLLPAYTFLTNGGHDIPFGVTVAGLHPHTSDLIHRGSTWCFRLMDEVSPARGCGLRSVSIRGATGPSEGSLPAVNGAVGVEVSNGQQHRLTDVFIDGYTGTGSVGLNFHIVDGAVEDLEYVEQSLAVGCSVVNCSTLVRFVADAGQGISFGYNQLRHLQMSAYADQIAIDVASGTLYNVTIQGSLHYAGNNVVGFNVGADGIVWQGTKLDLSGELLGGYTGCIRIRNDNIFEASGRFFINGPQPPDDLTGATTHDFVEDAQTWAELAEGADFDIASVATIAIPGGAEFFNVTGTTTITSISASWEGRRVTLKFAGALTVTDGSNLKLAGNFVTSADDTLTLICRSGIWYECSRSAN